MSRKSLGTASVGMAGCIIGVAAAAIGLSVMRNTYAAGEHGDHSKEAMDGGHTEPLKKIHLYLCAFHVAKNNPKFQIEAHHYCSPAGKDVHQCVVYDSNGPAAKMLGTEYIISDEIYKSLPSDEKKYWHPHAYEILSGQLVAPDAPNMGDGMFPGLITTWGKTFHTWPDPTTMVPMGEPLLMWSFGADGEVDPKLVAKRDAQFNINTQQIRERRAAWGYEVPKVPPPKSMSDLGMMWAPGQPTTPKPGK